VIRIIVFPVDFNFVVSLLGNIEAKAPSYTGSFIMVFLSLSRLFSMSRRLGLYLCYFQNVAVGTSRKNISDEGL